MNVRPRLQRHVEQLFAAAETFRVGKLGVGKRISHDHICMGSVRWVLVSHDDYDEKGVESNSPFTSRPLKVASCSTWSLVPKTRTGHIGR